MAGEAPEPRADAALVERIRSVMERITAACERAGRPASDVTLIAVSKTFPPSAVEAAAVAGVQDFGENRAQEMLEKAAVVPGVEAGGRVRWHMVGHLQRNKARDVVGMAHLFHALDSTRLAVELGRRSVQAGRVMPCLIQVNTSGEASKEGVSPEEVGQLVNEGMEVPGISVRGFMTIAAPAGDPEAVRHEFRALREIRDQQRQAHPEQPLDYLSMGMSGDFEVAIEEGATHVRVGRLIFGERA